MNINVSPVANDGFAEAVAEHLSGNTSAAIKCYARLLEMLPNHFGALRNLGIIELQRGAPDKAVRLFTKASRVNSSSPEIWRDLAQALSAAGRPREAVPAFRSALERNRNDPQTYLDLAEVFHNLGRKSEALKYYQLAISIKPDLGAAHNDMGVLFREMERFDEALEAFAAAAVFEPKNAQCRANLGNMLLAKGRIEDAVSAFKDAVALEPRRAQFLYYLAESKTFSPNDPSLALMSALFEARESLTIDDKISLYFALGKVLSDIGDHAGSFTHLLEGNRLKRSLVTYDEKATIGHIHEIQTKFSADFLRKDIGGGIDSPRPIFIVGMPRSGSTLVAQILSRHPKMVCPGEIDSFGSAIASSTNRKYASRSPASFFATVGKLTDASVNAVARRYLNSIEDYASGVERVVDKTLNNFLHLGLINLALPAARIIHIKRSPIDTCVSCFSKLFATGHGFAYDLGELGRYYQAYEKLMAHWVAVLPREAILEVNYEELVADFEAQSRRMIEHCGLEWDPICLRFYENKRWVHTSSVVQVRQPLYSSSVGRASKYDHRIEPLLTELRQSR